MKFPAAAGALVLPWHLRGGFLCHVIKVVHFLILLNNLFFWTFLRAPGLCQDSSTSASGMHHPFIGKMYPCIGRASPHLSFEWYNWPAGYQFDQTIDRLSQHTEKEAHLGLERAARIYRWSVDHGGICPTSMASVQAQERA